MASSPSLTLQERQLLLVESRIAHIEQHISTLERTIADALFREAPSAGAERILRSALQTRSILLDRREAMRVRLEDVDPGHGEDAGS